MVAVLALVGIIILGLTALIGLHRDVTEYVTVVSPIIASLLGLFVVSRQIDDVRDTNRSTEETVNAIQHQTNGRLDARFNELHDAIKKLSDRNGDIG